ncbi:MAG: asparagine synthase (glutamine-hydrolyzing), partial [Anaerostipes hadrus]|nr:asparagine synthase (glutamine-hydrolyzing) [Anaerostipes hadrus]
MCGIAGFLNPGNNHQKTEKEKYEILRKMNEAQRHRGPDDEGTFLENGCGLGHVRLSIIDLYRGHQPMCKKREGNTYAIILNGEIYNMKPLKEQLIKEGEVFSTTSDTEVVLTGYIRHGISYMEQLNGIFAIALWDGKRKKLYLIRDRVGVKPLFYTKQGDTLIFSSEIKGLFAYPGVKPVINREGLCEIFGLGPAKSYGKGVFKDIYEVLPGHFLEYDHEGLKDHAYWELKAKEHTDSEKDTIEHTRWLVKDAVEMQMLSDIPISTFLSGGVDSSLVTAICAKKLQKEGKNLNTFSFDFVNNHRYFKSNAFQPSEDRPWVDKMVDFAKTNHRYLECDNENMIENLYKAVDARDLPCMADVESSMLYFCSKVVKYNKVTLTGECADEIFGGYPWFHKEECFKADIFPWSMDMQPRKMLLNDDIIQKVDLESYARTAYQKTINETPKLYGEDQTEARRRQISYLNLRWFMVTLM